jgi:hypothetical protein
VRVPPEKRAELHFHLEAADGLAYLETGPHPSIGRLDVAPGNEARLRLWLELAAAELDLVVTEGEAATLW